VYYGGLDFVHIAGGGTALVVGHCFILPEGFLQLVLWVLRPFKRHVAFVLVVIACAKPVDPKDQCVAEYDRLPRLVF
jgi:hypothetical protein